MNCESTGLLVKLLNCLPTYCGYIKDNLKANFSFQDENKIITTFTVGVANFWPLTGIMFYLSPKIKNYETKSTLEQ